LSKRGDGKYLSVDALERIGDEVDDDAEVEMVDDDDDENEFSKFVIFFFDYTINKFIYFIFNI
jgi:hypothetical protein